VLGLAAILAGSGLGGCARANANATHEARGQKKAEISPEIAKKAEEILHAHPEGALGSEYPFTLDSKRYVGRIEEHDNPAGEPGRPPGKHRGVTVYSAE
jgi:hypothetical protein